MLDTVERGLFARLDRWDQIADPLDARLVKALLDWAWSENEFQEQVRIAYRLDPETTTESVRGNFYTTVKAWLEGQRFTEIASATKAEIDELLGVHTSLVAFSLQTLVEQGITLLGKLLEESGVELSPAVARFPEHLRFGVPTAAARTLSSFGIRHRRAAVELGKALTRDGVKGDDRSATLLQARSAFQGLADAWRQHLGALVFENTAADLRGTAS